VDKIKSNPNLVLYSKPGLNINYMMFPTDVAPWNNKKLRKAVSHAINKDEIVQYLYKGAAAPAVGALPPGMLGYYPELKAPEYDPEKARKLLAEAGFPKGLKTTLMAYPNPRLYNPAGARLVEMIQQMLDKIGVTADIQQMEWSTYLAESKKGFKSPGFLGWMGDNGDPDNFLFVLFDTKSIPGGNRSRYSNPKVDDLLLQAQQTMDESKRFELYKQAQEIVSDDAPIVPISHGNAMAATRSNVKGFKLHLLSINRFRGVKIE
ncbi:MAG: ABC transporter substrate-binding protein, partial [Actinobacteria bacterium]|nr:ABC transporter substrate-binding protein [Actinomycetota bacterium]